MPETEPQQLPPDFSANLATSLDDALVALDRELTGLRPPAHGPQATDTQRMHRLLREARRLVRADAGTIYVRHGDTLRFAAIQNDTLAARYGTDELRRLFQRMPLPINTHSIVGYVAVTGEIVNIDDVYHPPPGRPYTFNQAYDERYRYRTRSVLAAPIIDARKQVVGIVQVINALDELGQVTTFHPRHEELITVLAAEAAHLVEGADVETPAASKGPTEPATLEGSPAGAPTGLAAHPSPKASPEPTSRLAPWRLGELLVAKGLLKAEQLADALAEQKRRHEKLGATLIRLGFITDRQLVDALSEQYGIPTVDVDAVTVDPDVLKLVPADIARRYSVFPVERDERSLSIALADPSDLSVLDAVGFVTGLNIVPRLAPLAAIRAAIERAWESAMSAAGVLDELQAEVGDLEVSIGREEAVMELSAAPTVADDVPVVRLVNAILVEAIRRGASDIHLESFAKHLRVRYRIDGRLVKAAAPPKAVEAALVSRLKIMADLDIAQRRLPQDGRIKLTYNGRPIDLRVSIVPTLFGESVDLRILDGAVLQPDLSLLGFEPWGLAEFEKSVQDPHGVVLITGPTGSGKTTTLYSAIHRLSRQDLKVLTIEDPVEYALEGINQVHVQEDIGRTFAAVLRAFLRHDPDVILVGEMRDMETAQTAIRAGLTGHLVLSTLHTNDCASTAARLLDMGVPPFLLSSALRLVVAQRLLRKLCAECREPYEADEESLVVYGHIPRGAGVRTLYRARGCAACHFNGTRGRVGIFEVMPITPEISELILRHGSTRTIEEAGRQAGMKKLRQLGLLKVLDGLTTVDEVVRATSA